MNKLVPLFADAKTAAMLLCMSRVEFLRFVDEGALPGPCNLKRWDVQEIQAIMRNHKVMGKGLEI